MGRRNKAAKKGPTRKKQPTTSLGGDAFRRRRFIVEPLEDRFLLSGSHDPALTAAIQGALSTSDATGLSAWAHRLTDPTVLGQNLPIIGSGLETAVDPQAQLNTVLSGISGSYTTLTDLQAALQATPGITVSAVRNNANDLELDLGITSTGTATVPIDASLGANFNATGSLVVATSLHFQFTIGAYYDTTASTAVAYVVANNDNLSLSFNATSASLGGTAQLGFVNLQVSQASVNFSPQFTFTLQQQDAINGSDRVSFDALNADSLGTLMTTTLSQSAPATLTASVSTSLAPTAKQITLTWADVTDASTVTSSATTDPTLAALNILSGISPTAFSSGLDQAVAVLDAAATDNMTANVLQTSLPIVGQSLSSLVNFTTFYQTYLTKFTDSVTNTTTNVTTNTFNSDSQLLTLLQGIPNVGTGNVSEAVSGSRLVYTLTLPETVTVTEPLSLNVGSALNLNVAGTVNVSVATTTQFSFGVDAGTGTFFIAAPTKPVFQATVTASTSLTAAASLGFLSVNVTDGTVSATVQGSISLTDPATDSPASPGIITSSELASANFSTLIGVGLSGSASASLPLSVGAGAVGGISPGTLAISWPDVTSPSTFTVDTSGISQFLDFNQLSASSILTYLDALPNVLSQLGGTSGLGHSIPVIGSSLGSAIDFGSKLTTALSGLSSATSIQDLVTQLQSALPGGSTVTFDPATDQLDFTLALTDSYTANSPDSAAWSIDESLLSGALGFHASGTAPLTGSIGLRFEAGVQLSPDLLSDGTSTASTTVDPLSQVYVYTGSSTDPTVGSSLSASLSVQGTINASATLAFASIGVSAGTLTIAGTNSSGVVTPGTPATASLVIGSGAAGSKQTLANILANPSSLFGGFNFNGGAMVTLPLTGIPRSTNTPDVAPEIDVSWPNITTVPVPSTMGLDSTNLNPLANFDASDFTSGLTSVIGLITQWGNLPLLNQNIPLINEPISKILSYANDVVSVFNSISSSVSSGSPSSASALNTLIMNAVPGDITQGPSFNLANNVLDYDLNYSANVSTSVPFNLGLSILNVNANVTASAAVNVKLEFGFDAADGFYIVGGSDTAHPQLSVTGTLALNVAQAGLVLGPLQAGVANGTGNISLGFAVNLVPPSSGNGSKISATQLLSGAGSILSPTVSGSGALNLPLGVRLGSGGPGVLATFSASWDPNRDNPLEFGPNNSTDPTDGFGNVTFDLGEVVDEIVGPVLNFIKEYNPIPQSVLDALNTPLPFPLEGMTAGDVLGDYIDNPGVKLLLQIEQAIGLVEQVASLAYTPIDLSSYLPGSGSSQAAAQHNSAAAQSSSQTPDDASGDPENGAVQNIIDELKNDFYLDIPLLDHPTSTIIALFTGQNVNLVDFDPGHVEISETYSTPKVSVPLFSVGFASAEAFAQISFTASLFANIDIGLDTRGLLGHYISSGVYSTSQPSNVLMGFYISDADTGSANDGNYQAGIKLAADIIFGGEISILGYDAVDLYGGVGPYGIVGIHFNDIYYNSAGQPGGVANYKGNPAGDGKVYFDELDWIADNYGPLCAVMPGGELGLSVTLGGDVNLLLWSISFTIYQHDFTLATFDFPCMLNLTDLGSIQGHSFVMNNNTATDGRKIEVNIADDPNNNNVPALHINETNGNVYETDYIDLSTLQAAGVDTLVLKGSDGDDNFKIDPDITTTGPFRHLQVLTGKGNDQVDLSNFQNGTNGTTNNSNLTDVIITGGTGGTSDNDTITGNYAPDTIFAGDGANLIIPGTGNDEVVESSGDDTINAGGGNDTVVGGTGANVLINTGNGANTITAGSGTNAINAGDGNNVIHAGAGDDRIQVGQGNNLITAGAGRESITAGNGNDTIYADAGTSYITAGNGSNVITAGAGADQIHVGQGNNTIKAGAGSESVTAGNGNNTITADVGASNILAGNGNNVITAGAGADQIQVGQGNNLINAGTGTDTVISGNGNNVIYGDTGGSDIFAGTGNNFIYEDGGANVIYGHPIGVPSGNDYIQIGPGSTTLHGGEGDNLLVETSDSSQTLTDTTLTTGQTTLTYDGIDRIIINGGPENDSFDVSGYSAGNVTINGGGGSDTIASTDDTNFTLTNTTLTRATGANFSLNGITNAVLNSETTDNTFDVTHFTGNATLTGGGGVDTVVSSIPANYTLTDSSLTSSAGGKFSLAGISHAVLTGGSGSDQINTSGFSGNVTLLGAAGTDTITRGTGDTNIAGTTAPNPPATLLTGFADGGPWNEMGDSASGLGVSESTSAAIEPSSVYAAAGPYVAWADNRSGVYQIYVAQYVSGAWVELAGSAHGGGISNSAFGARRPSITLNSSGEPIVAWTQQKSGSSVGSIDVAQFNPSGAGAWVALPTPSGTSADQAHVVQTSAGPVVAWQDSSGATTNIYVARYSGSAWAALRRRHQRKRRFSLLIQCRWNCSCHRWNQCGAGVDADCQRGSANLCQAVFRHDLERPGRIGLGEWNQQHDGEQPKPDPGLQRGKPLCRLASLQRRRVGDLCRQVQRHKLGSCRNGCKQRCGAVE